ncbi:MFS transporter [Thalassospiraceae bacterium LMO-SO8]|nr:MFS transporter [Alphaproteobacteria bacterium LMO-S08]WND77028.1 MFS transporter [Thalassospiraceae bacterium LMO-SO8]
MLGVLANRTYRNLFLAQVISLVGTGLGTVALALLAFNIAGDKAGAVLGTALFIKMAAYVGLSPIAGALAGLLPRRAFLVSLDAVRTGIALMLPFVTQTWQIYLLIFFLQAASAAFTPTFQATIPDVLPDEGEYTKALSLSRLAYDLENLLSPAIAGALLTVMTFHDLFVGTALGFVASALFVLSVSLPSPKTAQLRSFRDRLFRGTRIFFATPRLRGLMAVNLAVAAGGAFVIVNTVVFVQSRFGLTEQQTALALASFGGGSMLVALALPRLLARAPDRLAMLTGVAVLAAGTGLASMAGDFELLLGLWFVLGGGYSLALTPSGRLLRRSTHPEDRPAVFAAQFALSHACWLITYPLAGWVGAAFGLPVSASVLAGVAFAGVVGAALLWPRTDREVVEHDHPDLPDGHPHLAEGDHRGDHRHAHAYVIDDLHYMWPHGR